MARPSVADERTRQIVEATIRTIGTHGITGATLDRIADEAGMSRGHVRHFVGNREELLRETARRFYFDGTDETSILPAGTDTVEAAVDWLFGPEFTEPNPDNAVVFAFVEASRADAAIADLLVTAYGGTQLRLARLIAAERPAASRTSCDATAYGILTMALGQAFMNDIQASPDRTLVARAAAEQLLGSLETGGS